MYSMYNLWPEGSLESAIEVSGYWTKLELFLQG